MAFLILGYLFLNYDTNTCSFTKLLKEATPVLLTLITQDPAEIDVIVALQTPVPELTSVI